MIAKQCTSNRAGNVAALVALLLPFLLGMVGFAIDGGMMMAERRHAQSVADAAAMAAACVFYQHYPDMTSGGSYSNNSYRSAAKTAAKNCAKANGYKNDGDFNTMPPGTSRVRVRFPNGDDDDGDGGPTGFTKPDSIYNTGLSTPSPTYAGNISDGCVEVTVYYFHARYFSRVWGADTIMITCRAVAKGAFVSPKNGVIVLNYTDGQTLTDKGGGLINIYGGSFIINSNASNAAVVTGGSNINIYGGTGADQQSSPEFDVTGGLSLAGGGATVTTYNTAGTSTNSIQQGIHPTPDPLAFLPAPNQPSQGTISYNSSTDTYTLTPGSYTGSELAWPNSGFGNSNVVFNGDGIYWFDVDIKMTGGSITQSGSTNGVMLYQNSGELNVTGSPTGGISLKGLPEGTFGGHTDVYTNMVFWQPKTNTNDITIAGNGNVSIEGTFYAPTTSLFTVTGNGTGGTGNDYGSQFVVNKFKVAGNGNVNINYSGGKTVGTRVLTLVE